MTAPLFEVSDYVRAIQQLLPMGPAWPRDDDATLTALLSGLAPSFNRTNAAAIQLLADAFPATVDDFLPEWAATLDYERIYGSGGSLDAQRQEVVAVLTDSGGQSIAYLVAYAATLGYTITIEQQVPYDVTKPVNAPLAGDSFAFAFQVNVATGSDVTRLRAMLDLYSPAHTTYWIHFT